MTKGIATMELRDYIEEGQKKAGGVKQLAATIGVATTSIPDAKAGRRGLPLVACYKLAELIDAKPESVAAASALVTEKDESAREYLRPFVQMGRLSHPIIAAFASTLIAIIQVANELASLTS